VHFSHKYGRSARKISRLPDLQVKKERRKFTRHFNYARHRRNINTLYGSAISKDRYVSLTKRPGPEQGALAKVEIGGQCKRSKLVCGGYESTATFIVYKPPQDGSARLSAQHVTALGQKPKTASPLTIASQALEHNALQTRILDDYWESFFPKITSSQSDYLGEWSLFMRNSYRATDLCKNAFLATGLAALGSRTGERRFQVAAMEAYSRALIDANHALRDSKKNKDIRVLAACKVLALYEVQQSTSIPF
jgi:hypothetical protein